MCSIQGIGFQKGHAAKDVKMIQTVISTLLINGMQRGRTATGVCYISNKKIAIVKDKMDADDFTKTEFYKNSLEKYVNFKGDYSEQLLSVMGHCRQKTKGTEENNLNNHPIRCKNVVGVHNGVIVNDDVQFEKYKDNFHRNAQVDSEIIFALIDHFSTTLESIPKGIQRTCTELSGGYACAMVHSFQPHILWLFRANSPCVVYHFKKIGMIIFSSQAQFIINSTYKHALGPYEEIKLDPYEGIGLDLYRNKYQRFDLEMKKHSFRGVV